jgi:hypothetical protein
MKLHPSFSETLEAKGEMMINTQLKLLVLDFHCRVESTGSN